MKRIVGLTLLLIYFASFGQKDTILDRLQKKVFNAKDDTLRAYYLFDVANYYYANHDVKSIEYCQQVLLLNQKLGKKRLGAKAYFVMGASYHEMEIFDEALNNLFKSLEISEEIKNDELLLRNFNQIGIVYNTLKQYHHALTFFEKFLVVANRTKDIGYIARGYNNLGIAYKNIKEYKTSSSYYLKALKIFEDLNEEQGVNSIYLNLGVNEFQMGNLDSAEYYYSIALPIAYKLKDPYALAIVYGNMGDLCNSKKQYDQALTYLDSSQKYARINNNILQFKEAYEGKYKAWEGKGNKEKAFDYLKKFLVIKDSIFNESTTDASNRFEENYSLLKKQKEIELLEKNEEIKSLELGRTRLGLLIAAAFMAALLILGYFLYRAFRTTKTQNKLLEKQKQEIEIQKTEILDSIRYAKRIQNSQLTTQKYIRRSLERLKKA